jgi:1-acyl-sn-glycerol-3-phosphate acyltransferase
MMALLRSTLFMLLVAILTIVFALLILLSFWRPPHARLRLVHPWIIMTCWLIEHLLGIRCRQVGTENIPAGPAVILAKHQSAWETIVLQRPFPEPIFVWKKELRQLPFFGWALAALPMICIDRSAGQDALRQLVEQGRQRLAEGYSVIVFPEGTRVAPGHKRRYKAGGASLAVAAGAPVIPVALNSGEVWGRNAFLKRPGVVTMSIGPAIQPEGLSAEELNARVEAWIENEMRRISPHLYPDENTQVPASPQA